MPSNSAVTFVQPLSPDPALVGSWSSDPGLAVRSLIGAMRFMPKGRGSISRWVGRHWLKDMRQSIRSHNGAIVAVDPHNLEVYVMNRLAADSANDSILRVITAFLQRKVAESASQPIGFYDIGANAGFMTLSIAKQFGESVHICSFEPQPALAERVAISTRLNGFASVQVFQTLLGDHNGMSDFFVPTLGVMASAVWYNDQTPGVKTIQCPMQRLDDLTVERSLPTPYLIKIDVEGAERLVLSGMPRLLREVRPRVLFESFARSPAELQERQNLVRLIADSGDYDFYFVGDHDFRPASDLADATAVDMVAVPRGKRRRIGFKRLLLPGNS